MTVSAWFGAEAYCRPHIVWLDYNQSNFNLSIHYQIDNLGLRTYVSIFLHSFLKHTGPMVHTFFMKITSLCVDCLSFFRENKRNHPLGVKIAVATFSEY